MGWDFRGTTTALCRPRGGLCVASCWHNTSGRLSGDGEGLHVAGPRFQGGSGAHICCAPVSNPNLGRTQFPLFPAPSTTQLYSWERGVKEAREHPPGEKETGELSVLPLSLTESHSPGSAGTATIPRSWEDTGEGVRPGQWPKWAGGKLSFQCNTKQDCLETEEMQERLYTHRLEAKSWSASGPG